jgi:chaperone BCS1
MSITPPIGGASSILQSLPFMISSQMNAGTLNMAFIKNTIMSIVIVSIVTAIVPKLSDVLNWGCGIINFLFTKLTYYTIQGKNKLSSMIFKVKMYDHKTVVIQQFPDSKTSNELFNAVEWYLTNDEFVDYKKEPEILLSYTKKIETLRDKEDVKLGRSVQKGSQKSIKYNGQEIWFSIVQDTLTYFEGKNKEHKKDSKKITITTDVERDNSELQDILAKLCNESIVKYKKYLETQKWIPKVWHIKNGRWDSSDLDNKRNIETIILKDNYQLKIKTDVERFMNGSEFYQKVGMPYKRGYLFYGCPGTGKSSMIRAMSNYTKRDVYNVHLSEIKSDSELFEIMRTVPHEKSIVIFEDIDCASSVVRSREEPDKKDKETDESTAKQPARADDSQRQQSQGLTQAGLLNVIDGIFDARGRILIMTSNHPDVLDPALIRPGRIDVKIDFGLCTKQQIADLYKLYYDKECPKDILDTIPDKKYSPAHISALFMSYVTEPDEVFKHIDDNNIEFVKPK